MAFTNKLFKAFSKNVLDALRKGSENKLICFCRGWRLYMEYKIINSLSVKLRRQ